MSKGKDGKFVIKTTDLELFWMYKELFPNAKYILNIRNPIDFIHSFHLFWIKVDTAMYPRNWDTPMHLKGLIALERCFMTAWLYRNSSDSMVVRLEDIDLSDVRSAIQWMKNIIAFTEQKVRSDDVYKNLFENQIGINTSTRVQGKEKNKAYSNFGLVRTEKMILKRCSAYIDIFYPGLSSEISNIKTENIFRRFLRYENIRLKSNIKFRRLRLLKRMLTFFREVV